MAYGAALERRFARKSIVGSNPTSSANKSYEEWDSAGRMTEDFSHLFRECISEEVWLTAIIHAYRLSDIGQTISS